jgi:hypothetical protein
MLQLCLVAHIRMDKAFSHVKQKKSKFLPSITAVHSHDVMRIAISEMEPNVNSLVEQRQAEVLH